MLTTRLGRVLRPAAATLRGFSEAGSARGAVPGDDIAAGRAKRQFMKAVHSDDVVSVQAFITSGGDVADPHLPVYPLHIAAACGFDELAKLLIDEGADVNFTAGVKISGPAALHLAAEKGHATTIDLLAEAGADVNLQATEHDATALHLAALNGHVDAVHALLAAGAAPDSLTASGADAEAVARDAGQTEVRKVLKAVSQG